MVLKEKGLLEKEFAKDGIRSAGCRRTARTRRWNSSTPTRSISARPPAPPRCSRKINGNPIKSIYVYSRPEWTALVTTKDTAINKVADLKGKKRRDDARHRSAHLHGTRAAAIGPDREGHHAGARAASADGETALIRGDVDAWAGLDPMMAQARDRGRREAVLPQPGANTWGILNVREEFLKDHPDLVRRVLAVYEEARKYLARQLRRVKKTFIAATKLPEEVVDKQLKERTELTHNKVGAAQRESILASGFGAAEGGRDPGRASTSRRRSTASSTIVGCAVTN